jgi:hypothetical protein
MGVVASTDFFGQTLPTQPQTKHKKTIAGSKLTPLRYSRRCSRAAAAALCVVLAVCGQLSQQRTETTGRVGVGSQGTKLQINRPARFELMGGVV